MKHSPAQQRVIDHDRVTLVGHDAKDRPVVRALVGIPNQMRQWAVLRSGDPTDVTLPVTPLPPRAERTP